MAGMAFVLEGSAISSTWLTVFAACFLFATGTVLAGRGARLGILVMAAFGLTLPLLPLPPWSTAAGNVVFVLGLAAAIELRRRTALSLAICWICLFLVVSWLNRGTPGLLKALDDSLLHLSLCNAGSFFLAVSIPAVAAVDIARQKAEFGELIQAVKDSAGHVVSRVQRVLHDRVIAVLMTISNSGIVDRRSVDEAIDEIHGVASDLAPDAARPTDLVALLGGLTSRTTLSVEIRLLGRPGGWPAVSVHQAGAVARALEEVLRNAERHGIGDGLLLTAAHSSRGFVVTAENPHRSGPAQAGGWGWVNSVRMPMEAIGGGATRTSGAETSRVEIWWPVAAQLPEHQRVYAETVGALGPAGTGVIALIWPVLAAHTYLGLRYTPWGMAAAWHVLSWVMVLGVTVAAARRLRHAQLGGVAHLGISVVLAGACWLSLQALPPTTLRSYESWMIGLISVPQCLLAFFSPARRVAVSVTPVAAIVVWYALVQDGPGLADSAGALVAAVGPWCGVLLGWLLRNSRRQALAQEARLRDQSTRLYVKLTDRQVEERYLSGTRSVVLPWLAALADGSLSAADPTVRDEARLLAMRTRDDLYLPGVLDRPLQERITTARRRGVTVTIHPLEGDPAPEVMLAFRLLDRALDHLDPGGRALVHLRDGGRAFTLSLIAPTEVDWLGHLTPALSTVPYWTRADDFATTIGVGLPDSGDGVSGRTRVKEESGHSRGTSA
jgi:hypothetical protein